jgi:hypothetical protein
MIPEERRSLFSENCDRRRMTAGTTPQAIPFLVEYNFGCCRNATSLLRPLHGLG